MAATCDGTGTRSAQEDADKYYRHAYRAHHGSDAPEAGRPPFSSFYPEDALRPYESVLPEGTSVAAQMDEVPVVDESVTSSRAFTLDDSYQDLAGLRLDLGLRCDEPVPLPEPKDS